MPAERTSAGDNGQTADLPGGQQSGQGLSRRQRLTEAARFREAFDQGNSLAGKYMVMWLRRGTGADLRLGVVTSRRIGNAVARAKARRLLREVYRRNRHRLKGEVDVVLVGRRALADAAWPAIESDFLKIAGRAGLYSS